HHRAATVGGRAGGPAVDLGGTVGTGGGGHGAATSARLVDREGVGDGRVGGVVYEHRDSGGIITGHREIRLAIAIEVGHGHRRRTQARPEVLCGLEGPIAVAQQHRNGGRNKV